MKTKVLCCTAVAVLLLLVAGDVAFGQQCANGRCLLPRIRPQAAPVSVVVHNTIQTPVDVPAMPVSACECSAPPASAVTTNVTAFKSRTIRNGRCCASSAGDGRNGLLRRLFSRR